MKNLPLFNWFYGVFVNTLPAEVGYPDKGDNFEALHREFLWLKNNQIDAKISKEKQDSVIEKNLHKFFEQTFIDTLTQESIGGNAGAGHTGINAFYHPVTGEIKYFGNFHELKEAFWDEMKGQTTLEGYYHCIFRINVQHSGEIAEILFEQEPLTHQAKERLLSLVGFQVMIPFTRVYQALRCDEIEE